MAQLTVTFTFHSGVKKPLFRNVRLSASWNASGQYSDQWSEMPMTANTDEAGCEAFRVSVSFDASLTGTTYHWGVIADTDRVPNNWVIGTEVQDKNSSQRYRSFTLAADSTQQDYWFALGRKMGAQKCFSPGAAVPGIGFSVWAPNAQAVDVVFAPFDLTTAGTPTGYISDDGFGIDPTAPVIPLHNSGDGIWTSDLAATPTLAKFDDFMNRLYMYRIRDEQGDITYRVDIYSRNQAGRGATNPGGAHYQGTYLNLDGIVSCSVVSDPDQVTQDFNDTGVVKQTLISSDEFWATEYSGPLRPPTNLQDLVIYELHVGSLGYPSTDPGTFTDAMNFLDKLVEIGVNAVELLPVMEFDGDSQWGYGTSLFYCMQSSAGGANQLKHFIRACHQRGLAVIFDVVYNHYAVYDAERSEWGYDSNPGVAPQHNIWNWYEGLPSDYPGNINGGYVNNGSSGFAPRFWDEHVRRMFTGSAAALLDDFHVDGFRVDLTDALHQDNSLNANGASVPSANLFGIKFMRELVRTVKMVNPAAFLIAEDHTGWSAMTQSQEQGGIGFDAAWYVDLYHHLIGDGNYGGYADLLRIAGYGAPVPLNMDYLAGALLSTQYQKIAYHENHDEAGNDPASHRTIFTAVNGAPLIGDTRKFAEARSRFAFGMSVLSAGIPMFLMGEEIGAAKDFTTTGFSDNKEDLIGQRTSDGQYVFKFYQDLINFVTKTPAARSQALDVIYTHNGNRVIAFARSAPAPELLVLASLNDSPFGDGYFISTDSSRLPAGGWKEVFNSDATAYRGDNVGNGGSTLQLSGGSIHAAIPAHGFVVFQKVS